MPDSMPDPTPVAPGTELLAGALARQYAELGAALRGADGSPSADDVHRARVAARRLRSLLKTFATVLDAPTVRICRLDLRSFGQAYGQVREADVRRELLLGIGRDSREVTPAEQRRLDAVLSVEADAARAALRTRAAEPAWSALIGALGRQPGRPGLAPRPDVGWPDVLALVERPWRKAMRLIAEEPDDELGLHELRLALKHCRYALEPVADLAAKPGSRLMRRLRAVQDSLGEHRDAVQALAWLDRPTARLSQTLVAKLRDRLEREERRRRRRAQERIEALQPAYDKWHTATHRFRRRVRRRRVHSRSRRSSSSSP